MANWADSTATLGPFFSTEAMSHIFSDTSRIQAMLDVEAALARAEAACGVIPDPAAAAIGAVAWAENFEFDKLGQDALKSGNLAVPLVKALTALVASSDEDAARWVHWGATSQDIVDTGLVLQMRDALAVVEEQLETLGDRLASLADEHAETPMAARTLMQQAIPTTLGLKLAGWLSALTRARQSLEFCKSQCLVLQFGGAAGNLASLAPDGLPLSASLADELGLGAPSLPWHTERDRIAEMGCWLGMLLGTLGKIARDLSLMAQTEIGEFREPSGDGRGGSSAMPHKANPVACARILAASKRAPGLAATLLATMEQENERGLGGWQAEWEVMPELFRLTSAALEAACTLIREGCFDQGRMRRNLDLTSGLVMAEAASIALGRAVGKSAAHRLMERAAKKAIADGVSLRACMEADQEIAAHLGGGALDAIFAPESHFGAATEFTKRAVSEWRGNGGGR